MVLGLLLIRLDFLYRRVRRKISILLKFLLSFKFQILRKRSLFWQCVTWSSIIITILILGIYQLIKTSNHPLAIHKNFIYLEPFDSFFRRTDLTNDTKDWNDYEQIKNDRGRVGYGELGLKTYTQGDTAELEYKMMQENGHNALVSDLISLDRSVPDLRNHE
jgi:hypothetical protein